MKNSDREKNLTIFVNKPNWEIVDLLQIYNKSNTYASPHSKRKDKVGCRCRFLKKVDSVWYVN